MVLRAVVVVTWGYALGTPMLRVTRFKLLQPYDHYKGT
jgi:hypothetical protein